ncbi:MFS transporter [Streptomyces sp. NPDC050617]|uniref:MFS transporter n=1 Tax=Streptomyces sp. NPDC050617 TaxID=3154628 RepID=UPI00343E5A12
MRTVPGGPGILVTGVVSRLGTAMNPLALLLLLKEHTGRYAFAAVACALYAVASAMAGPPLGRLCDRIRPAPVLYAVCAVHLPAMLGLLAAVHQDAPRPVLLLLLVLAGAATPPVTAVVRAAWYLRTDRGSEQAGLRSYALAAETVCAELVFVLGPLLVAGTLLIADVTSALVLSTLCCVGGTCVLARNIATRQPLRPRPTRTQGLGPLRLPGFGAVLWCTAAVSTAFGITDVAIPAAALHRAGGDGGTGMAAGFLLSLWAGSSLLSGLLFGADNRGRPPFRRLSRLLLMLAAGMAVLSTAPNLPALSAGSLFCGLVTGPTLIVLNGLVADIVPPAMINEAYVWVASLTVVCCSAGTAVAGPMADQPGGTSWAFLSAALVAAAAAGTAFAGSTRASTVGA